MVWKACLACLLKACLACLEDLSSWLEGWCWLGGRLAVESNTHDALRRSADIYIYIYIYQCILRTNKSVFV